MIKFEGYYVIKFLSAENIWTWDITVYNTYWVEMHYLLLSEHIISI